MYVKMESATHTVLNCEGTQGKENGNTLNILKPYKVLFLFAKDSGKLKHFLFLG